MIKKANIFIMTILFTGCLYGVVAQEPPPPTTPSIADNASPFDNSIKMRSVELERIKREAEKTATLRRDNGTELKFSLIKEDFEGIQKEQMSIVEAYMNSESIDYKAISKSSNKITEMAVRLRANVFISEQSAIADNVLSEEVNPFVGKSVRDLIVVLDNAIGEVVLSPMWQKLKVVDADVSNAVEASLVNVINASSALWGESDKMKTK